MSTTAQHAESTESEGENAVSPTQHGYLNAGPLRMYYERTGTGRPLVLLHAGMSTIETSFGRLQPVLAQHRTIVAFEQQAHGRTADIDRPLRYEQMVEDTATCLQALKLSAVDLFGWSDGGIVALGLAVRYPELTRKVAIIGAGYSPEAEGIEFKQKMKGLRPDNPNLEPFRAAYEQVAPNPQWPSLIEKCKDMYFAFQGWPTDELRALKAPLLVMLGDHDFLRPEHALELSRLVPQGTLSILPASDHAAPITRAEWIGPMLADFFDSIPA